MKTLEVSHCVTRRLARRARRPAPPERAKRLLSSLPHPPRAMHACAVARTAATTVSAKTLKTNAPRRAVVKPARRSNVVSRGVGPSGDVKKVVLAYSGGLDTSIILKWLQDTYGCEVVTFTADLGQGEELEPARAKAAQLGVKEIFVDDLREEFVRDYVFPMFRANALY